MALVKDLIVQGNARFLNDAFFAIIKSGTWNGSPIDLTHGGTAGETTAGKVLVSTATSGTSEWKLQSALSVGSATTATTATYASNVGASGTAGTNYVTAAKVIATCNWYDTMTGSDTDTVINRWSEIVAFVANFTETPDLATFLSNNYLAKSGGTMTGPIKWTDATALPEQTSPQYFVCIDAFNSGGTTKWASKANTLKALTGLTSTAVGDSDEPVYWDGSKFVKAGAYPTKASWNYDDVYLKLVGGTLTGDLTIKSNSGDSPKLIFQRGTLTDNLDDWRIFDTAGNLKFQHTTGSTTTWKDYVVFSATAGTVTINGSTVWHAGNDGSGSTLDADLLDGAQLSKIYKTGYAWGNGRTDKPWHLVAEYTKEVQQITEAISFFVSENYGSTAHGILNIRLRVETNGTLTNLILSWSNICNINLEDFVVTHQISDGTVRVKLYCMCTSYKGFAFRVLSEHSWYGASDVWTMHNASGTNEYCFASIPSEETQIVSIVETIKNSIGWDNVLNKPSTFPVATHDHDDAYLKLTGGTLSNQNAVLTISSSTANSYMYFKSTVSNALANRASVGYYSGLAYIANEKTYARIGVTDDGTPQYWSSNSSSTAKTLLHTGNTTPVTLTLSTSAQTYLTAAGNSYTLQLPATDPYTSARTPTEHTHYATRFADTRNTAGTPTDAVAAHGVAIDFKTKANGVNAGSGAYCGVVTFGPYSDASGGYPLQMGFNTGADTNNTNELYIRTAKTATVWNAWRTVITSSNITTYINDCRNNIVDLRTNPQTFNPSYLKDIVFISEADYTTLVSNGSITKNSITHTYNTSNWYVIEDKVPTYAESAGNAAYASSANLINMDFNSMGSWTKLTFASQNVSPTALHASTHLQVKSNKGYLYLGSEGAGNLSDEYMNSSTYKGAILLGSTDVLMCVDSQDNLRFGNYSGGAMSFNIDAPVNIEFYNEYEGDWAYISAYLNWSNVTDKPDYITWGVTNGTTTSGSSYSLSNNSWTQTITLPSTVGSYILQIRSGKSTHTGVFSIGSDDNVKDEINLHLHGSGPRIYARTNGTKLELSKNADAASATTVVIKYRRLI